MKTLTNLRTGILLCFFFFQFLHIRAASADSGFVSGFVYSLRDSVLQKPVEFALISAKQNGILKATVYTDSNGRFRFKLPVGSYVVVCQEISHKSRNTSITIRKGATTNVKIGMEEGNQLQELQIKYSAPIIKPSEGSKTIERKVISKAPARSLNKVAATTGSTYSPNGGTPSFAGSRTDGTRYYVDGVHGYVPSATPNTESYAHFEENRFYDVFKEPLSTFSLDVDAASYSNTRRFINGGELPPPGSIRIEEFINYFPYESVKARSDEPFSVDHELSDCPWNDKAKLMRIVIKGREVEANKSAPQNLVFLIDVSGSMQYENKLPLVQKSLQLLVKSLRKEDRISMVVYAGNSGLVLPATSGADKNKILEAIGRLNAGGSTAGAEGIELAYKVAKENFIEGGNNRIILATDGDFNVGISSPDELVRLIEEKRKSKIFLTVLGYGMGNYKDDRLEALADKGNGNYYYIDSYNEAAKVFGSELSATLITIAKDVKLQLEFNPETVSSYRLVGYENRILQHQDFDNDLEDAGDVGAGKTVVALYELLLNDKKSRDENGDTLRYQTHQLKGIKNELLAVKIRYKDSDKDISKKLVIPVSGHSVPLKKSSDDFRFSASVAEFGMLLRNSAFKGTASYDEALKLAKDAKGKDEEGHRSEYIRLVKMASEIAMAKK